MRIFGPLYDRVLAWAGHRHAVWYLGALSFAESSFFPIPPDVLLAPMTLAKPVQGPRLALITTLTSVLGGVAGWLIGYFALDWAFPIIENAGYAEHYQRGQQWFVDWGFWAVLIAGFSPIPYKIFTIAAGAAGMFLPVFIVASIIGRGSRFFLVAFLVMRGGPVAAAHLRRHVDLLGWLFVALVVAVLLLNR